MTTRSKPRATGAVKKSLVATKNGSEKVAESVTKEALPIEDVPVQTTPLNEFFDHQRKALTEAGRALEALIPTAFVEHGQAAFKEVVEGYRKLLNSALDEVMKILDTVRSNAAQAVDTVADKAEELADRVESEVKEAHKV